MISATERVLAAIYDERVRILLQLPGTKSEVSLCVDTLVAAAGLLKDPTSGLRAERVFCLVEKICARSREGNGVLHATLHLASAALAAVHAASLKEIAFELNEAKAASSKST